MIITVTWSVCRASDEPGDPLFHWAGQLLDTEEDESGILVGRVTVYVLRDPLALGDSVMFDLLDGQTADLGLVGEAVLESGGYEQVLADYADNESIGLYDLLVIGALRLEPAYRRRGLTELVLNELRETVGGIRLVMCYPHPIHHADLTESERLDAVDRLSRHWQRHGLQPMALGIHVAAVPNIGRDHRS